MQWTSLLFNQNLNESPLHSWLSNNNSPPPLSLSLSLSLACTRTLSLSCPPPSFLTMSMFPEKPKSILRVVLKTWTCTIIPTVRIIPISCTRFYNNIPGCIFSFRYDVTLSLTYDFILDLDCDVISSLKCPDVKWLLAWGRVEYFMRSPFSFH